MAIDRPGRFTCVVGVCWESLVETPSEGYYIPEEARSKGVMFHALMCPLRCWCLSWAPSSNLVVDIPGEGDHQAEEKSYRVLLDGRTLEAAERVQWNKQAFALDVTEPKVWMWEEFWLG